MNKKKTINSHFGALLNKRMFKDYTLVKNSSHAKFVYTEQLPSIKRYLSSHLILKIWGL